MITTFEHFLNESFQFEHDVDTEFDKINSSCFNNEIKKVPIEFVTSKKSKAFVDIVAKKTVVGNRYEVSMRVVRLCISKNYNFTHQQLKDTLAHEMIHVLLAQRNIYKDFGGSHGTYFCKEMYRINKLNVGINVGLAHDTNIKEIGVRDELKGLESNKIYYIYLQNETNIKGKDHYNLTPFSNKQSLIEFWERKTKNLEYVLNKLLDYKYSTFDICMGETKLSDVGHFPISRMMKTAKLFIIDKDKYEKIKSSTTIYNTQILKND